jgi:hypothetical protein
MSKQNKSISFNLKKVGGNGDYTLIPAGRYAGTINDARFVTVQSTGEQRLWIQFLINAPKQAGRYVTTLCVLEDTAASAYKTKSLIEATEAHLGSLYLPADPTELIGAFVSADIVIWTPRNGNTTNDIKVFAPATQKAAIAEVVEEVASHFDIAQAEVMAAKKKQTETQY